MTLSNQIHTNMSMPVALVNALERSFGNASGNAPDNIQESHVISPENTAMKNYEEESRGGLRQWLKLPDNHFMPCQDTCSTLTAGVYESQITDSGLPVLTRLQVIFDSIVNLPDSASDKVLASIRHFWKSEDKFLRKGHLYKRGIMLFGNPGSGKTVTIIRLMQDLISEEGIVLLVRSPVVTKIAIQHIRRLEPKRRMICVLEDLDELVRMHGEAEFLALLDGEYQTNNVLFLASTNYPEKLDDRFINRPSRFDEVIKIDMPSAEARRTYLYAKLDVEEAKSFDLDGWVSDTDGLSIAHLRELIIAVTCLGRPYDEVIARLTRMKQKPSSRDTTFAVSSGQYA